jgi:threonylcarbamoyladenosine tRNA methylthiotransferase MtaB
VSTAKLPRGKTRIASKSRERLRCRGEPSKTRDYPIDRLDNVAGYHVENFGCRTSRADGEAIAANLRQRGMEPARGTETASVVVVNTCSVTAEADRSARAFLRRLQRDNPHARVVVTGCYAQRAPSEVASLPGVTEVVGNSHKSLVPAIAARLARAGEAAGFPPQQGFVPLTALGGASVFSEAAAAHSAPILVDPHFAHADLATLLFSTGGRQTRPNLKVQDGCGNRCSFCVIPETRGPSRSLSLDACLRAVDAFVSEGGHELVLSGINLGRWGRDLHPVARFEDLVAAILDRTRLQRLRISSVEPMDWSAELLALYRTYGRDDGAAGPRLARHAHLPLQSGSDTILRRMHRRYRPWHYAAKAAAIREAMPDVALGADVMVGFPGETETHFRETHDFLAALPFTYLHLFPFSARPGTPAWELEKREAVPHDAVEERMAALRRLAAVKHLAFRQRFVGGELAAITLEGSSPDRTPALSDNFLKLDLAGSLAANQSVRAIVTGLTAEGLSASLGRLG